MKLNRFLDKMCIAPAWPLGSERHIKSLRLTHLILVLQQTQTMIQDLLAAINSWKLYHPCRPTSHFLDQAGDSDYWAMQSKVPLGHSVSLVIYLSGTANKTIESFVYRELYKLPQAALLCFSKISIRYAGLDPQRGYHSSVVRKWMFEQVIYGKIGLSMPGYVLYMELPFCKPVQMYWLEQLDRITRYPNLPFWVKGSLFLGDSSVLGDAKTDPATITHINACAIYRLDTIDFASFYRNNVQRISAIYAPDMGIFRFLWKNPSHAFSVIHNFQYTKYIANHWNSNQRPPVNSSAVLIIN